MTAPRMTEEEVARLVRSVSIDFSPAQCDCGADDGDREECAVDCSEAQAVATFERLTCELARARCSETEQTAEVERLTALVARIRSAAEKWGHGDDCPRSEDDVDVVGCKCCKGEVLSLLTPPSGDLPGAAFLALLRDLLRANEDLRAYVKEIAADKAGLAEAVLYAERALEMGTLAARDAATARIASLRVGGRLP